jgi:hypothetical protein
VELLADLPEGTVVDGELVGLNYSGRPDFNLLRNFLSCISCALNGHRRVQ